MPRPKKSAIYQHLPPSLSTSYPQVIHFFNAGRGTGKPD